MLFKDEVSIYVKSGKGGDGAATFRREKFIPKGGPDGGDGGDGGSIVLKASPQLRTLSHIHNNQKFKAQSGENGMNRQKFGKNGDSLTIEVPTGTIVFDKQTGDQLYDLVEDGMEFVAAQGGYGGKGNVHFKSSTNQTPFYAQKGKPAIEAELHLELKLIAHIGLVGFPNAGKSTLISRITNAKPKIAAYPFTTLEPNLGVMNLEAKYASVMIADIPGLIEGAHKGKGLGIEFLKHIERTKIILYILDITEDPMEKFRILREELKGYSKALFDRDFLVALNKIDLDPDRETTQKLLTDFAAISPNTMAISGITGDGLEDLKWKLYQMVVDAENREREEN